MECMRVIFGRGSVSRPPLRLRQSLLQSSSECR